MNRQDLSELVAAAEIITRMARRNEAELRAVVDGWDTLLDHGEPAMIALISHGFNPLSQALANWRSVRDRLFPF